jgi:hypothetical protein
VARPKRRWGGLAAAILTTLLAAVAIFPAASQARSGGHRALKMIWGTVDLANGKSAFPTYHKLGVQVFQIELNWAQTAPTKPANPKDPSDPAYQWPAALSQALASAARYHIRVCVLVIGAPSWATGNPSPFTAPIHPSDFGNFLTAAARKYPSVRDWMIWGEPNRSANFSPEPTNSPVGPRRYALLLNAGYHALKAVSAKNVVIGGNNASYGTVNPQQFVNAMRLPNGKPRAPRPRIRRCAVRADATSTTCRRSRPSSSRPITTASRCGCPSSRSRRTRTTAPSTSTSRARNRRSG